MSNVTLLITIHKELSKNSICDWKTINSPYTSHYDLDFIKNYNNTSSLFEKPDSIIIELNDIKKIDFEYILKITDTPVLLIVNKKPKFNLKKYNCEVVDDSYKIKDMKTFLQNNYNLDNNSTHYILQNVDNDVSKIIIARQISFLSDFNYDIGKYIVDPLLSPENAPWRLFDAILNGQGGRVIKECEMLFFNEVDPIALYFQTIGYMKKIIVSLDDDQNIIEDSKVSFFRKKAKKIKDIPGFNNDMSEISNVIFSIPKSHLQDVMKSLLFLMSQRCK